jgi:hypothetical protein
MLRNVLFFKDIDSWNETENLKQRKQTRLRPAGAAKQIKPQTCPFLSALLNIIINQLNCFWLEAGECDLHNTAIS